VLQYVASSSGALSADFEGRDGWLPPSVVVFASIDEVADDIKMPTNKPTN
jgi:hypothetical protein